MTTDLKHLIYSKSSLSQKLQLINKEKLIIIKHDKNQGQFDMIFFFILSLWNLCLLSLKVFPFEERLEFLVMFKRTEKTTSFGYGNLA